MLEEYKKEEVRRYSLNRLFDIFDDDLNSNALCHCFKNISLTVIDQRKKIFKNIEGRVILDDQYKYHVFFFNGLKIIDPTFSQFIRKQNLNPERIRKKYNEFFINKVFVGQPEEAKRLGIRYCI